MRRPGLFIFLLLTLFISGMSLTAQSSELGDMVILEGDSLEDSVPTDDLVFEPEGEPLLERIPSKSSLLFTLDVLREAIQTDRYALAVNMTRELLDKFKQARKTYLVTFFPTSFGDYHLADQPQIQGYFSSVEDDYGVILTRQYANDEDGKVDISLVYSDPSINEYAETISSPRLVKTLPNVKLVKIDGFKGIRKFSKEDQVYELNLLLSKDVLINVVALGVNSEKDMKLLLDQIDFENILTLLD